jgi:hypothetical protein
MNNWNKKKSAHAARAIRKDIRAAHKPRGESNAARINKLDGRARREALRKARIAERERQRLERLKKADELLKMGRR